MADPTRSRSGLVLVVVVDGLRPDAVTAAGTPSLHALRRAGAECTAGHAVAPPVTRVNAATLATGRHPSATGITGNRMYVPALNRSAAFSTADARNLYRLGEATGAIIQTRTLAERLSERGKRLVAIGSGSSGATLCLNPCAARGVGVMINADDPRTGAPLAYPDSVREAVLARFGAPPRKGEAARDRSVDYACRVLADYVLPELTPDVVLLWLTEPDGSQHRHGVGSRQALDAIRNVDRSIGALLGRLRELGIAERTSVLVVSDHGFSQAGPAVDVAGRLVDAGVKRDPRSTDVVVARTGSAGLFVADRGRLRQVVAFLQREPWVGALFTAAPGGADAQASAQGWVEGTFALDVVGLAGGRSPDILVTFPCDGDRTTVGAARFAGSPGAGQPRAGDHGNLSPADIGTTFLAWGAGIRRGVVSAAPVGNVDVTPTVLALLGLDDDLDGLDGRVVQEVLEDGRTPAGGPARVDTFTTQTPDGAYRAALRVASFAGSRYVDGAWRLPSGAGALSR